MLQGKNARIPVLHNRSVHHYCKDRQLSLIRAKATRRSEWSLQAGTAAGRGRSDGLMQVLFWSVARRCTGPGGEFRIGI